MVTKIVLLKLLIAIAPAWVERPITQQDIQSAESSQRAAVRLEQRREVAESKESRDARLDEAADAILMATTKPSEVAALVRLAWEETKFARYVYHGCVQIPKGAGNCDRVMKGKHKGEIRARSYWQLWQRSCPDLWRIAVGTRASTIAGAKCALKHWRAAMRHCSKQFGKNAPASRIAGAFSGYRKRSLCSWGPSKARAVRYEKWRAKLVVELRN